jgi:hypothetical protein
MIATAIARFIDLFRADDGFHSHELFVEAYSRKYGVSRTRIMQLVEEGVLSATTIEGMWVVEDKPPNAGARPG